MSCARCAVISKGSSPWSTRTRVSRRRSRAGPLPSSAFSSFFAYSCLSLEQALATVTIDAARILGLADRVGSLENGKDADLALFDGDPFEYTTHVTTVIIDGHPVSTDPH